MFRGLKVAADGFYQPTAHLVGDDTSECRLAEAWGARQKYVGDSGVFGLCRTAENFQDAADSFLPDEVFKAIGADV